MELVLTKFKQIKRIVITALIIIICFLLESTVFQNIQLISVTPNLLIIITASFGFMRGKKEGMTIGFFSGLLIDLFWGNMLGFHMLIYTVIGYLNGTFKRLFYDEDLKLPIILITCSELLYGFIIYGCMYMLQGDFSFGNYLFHIIIPELVYTILVTLVLYQLILKINRRLESEEQRSASKFV